MREAMSGIELIAGIPSYLEADTISFVTSQVDRGLTEYFPRLKAVIVNIDNHSEDGTKEAFLSTPTKTPKLYITTPKGVKGKGNNLLNLFKFAGQHLSSLQAAVVVDADLRSIVPEWIRDLVQPIRKGYDYALPLYARHQFDGTITNHICYPLIYGLLGKDLRQPIGGEFGFSPRLIKHWLKQKWNSDTRQYGIDVFMTLHTLFSEFKICEVGLGTKVHKASSPKLGPMFTQVITTLFDILLSHEPIWIGTPVIRPKQKARFGLKELGMPQEIKVDMRDLKEKLRQEYYQRQALLRRLLSDYASSILLKMFEQDSYHIDILMWTQVVYQLLFSYGKGSSKTKKDIIEALKPLYFARSVTFNYETWRYSAQYVQEALLAQAKAFASQKPYFLGLHMNEKLKKNRKKGTF